MTATLNALQTVAPASENGFPAHPGQTRRFTLDGSDALEDHLACLCKKALAGVHKIIPSGKLDALVLGGGYGRGEGGVLKTGNSDQPYNDLEFYVFLRGNRLWNEHQFDRALRGLGERLSPEASLHVEFKVDSLARLRRSPVTMFSYDLVSGHHIVAGNRLIFRGCEHHLDSSKIPLAEATRLMMNRCSGLLFAREKLACEPFSVNDADFVYRNIAKAKLAFGDAVLAVSGRYHWSCLERRERLQKFSPPEFLPWLDEVRQFHADGAEFKLHPRQVPIHQGELASELAEITALGLQIWLWLENRRLGSRFESLFDYTLSPINKCPGTNPWRNFLLNVKVFGPAIFWQANRCRHPRERVLNALSLLLWKPLLIKSDLQRQLHLMGLSLKDDARKQAVIYHSYWSHLN
jgi:hypothetical protein